MLRFAGNALWVKSFASDDLLALVSRPTSSLAVQCTGLLPAAATLSVITLRDCSVIAL